MPRNNKTHGTAIEWTHIPGYKGESWNPIRAQSKAHPENIGHFCEHVTEACRNFYAEHWQFRMGTKLAFKPGHRKDVRVYLDDNKLTEPLRWKAPRAIFVCSMTDLFGEWVHDAWLDRIFAVMALCPQHIFIVLTKRPERMRRYCDDFSGAASCRRISAQLAIPGGTPPGMWPLPNVWLGTSVCDQSDADKFIPTLLDTPAAVRLVSYEPALGPVDFTKLSRMCEAAHYVCDALRGIHTVGTDPGNDATVVAEKLDWIICGGESGPESRPMHPDWARSVRDQCASAGTAFFFKQWGEWHPCEMADNGVCYPMPGHAPFDSWKAPVFDPLAEAGWNWRRLGKARAGRLLDGVEHNDFPPERRALG